jgi:hypothetical protein
MMRERGYSKEDAAHAVDKSHWRPDVSQPIPEG